MIVMINTDQKNIRNIGKIVTVMKNSGQRNTTIKPDLRNIARIRKAATLMKNQNEGNIRVAKKTVIAMKVKITTIPKEMTKTIQEEKPTRVAANTVTKEKVIKTKEKEAKVIQTIRAMTATTQKDPVEKVVTKTIRKVEKRVVETRMTLRAMTKVEKRATRKIRVNARIGPKAMEAKTSRKEKEIIAMAKMTKEKEARATTRIARVKETRAMIRMAKAKVVRAATRIARVKETRAMIKMAKAKVVRAATRITKEKEKEERAKATRVAAKTKNKKMSPKLRLGKRSFVAILVIILRHLFKNYQNFIKQLKLKVPFALSKCIFKK